MTNINADRENYSLSELISRVAESGERIVIEREGKEIAAIITQADLKRFEAWEAVLLEKAELEEYEWLKAVIRNPAFDSLRSPEEDIYTLADGEPFHDPEWTKAVINDPNFVFISAPKEDIYTLADGELFYDEG